jgi:hypothetical protein
MKIDYSPRASGKTTRMIEWLRENPQRILVTFNHAEENRLKHEYPDLSMRILEWRSYQQRYMHGNPVKEVAFERSIARNVR